MKDEQGRINILLVITIHGEKVFPALAERWHGSTSDVLPSLGAQNMNTFSGVRGEAGREGVWGAGEGIDGWTGTAREEERVRGGRDGEKEGRKRKEE